MATVTKRAACCNQATPARRTGQPAVRSRSSYSIARKKHRAKYLRRQIACLLLAAAALTALIYVVVGALTPDKPTQKNYTKKKKKKLHNPDNHDGVITHLEPDILECEIRWAFGSIRQS